jgi:ABC-type uncharacterized transport system substrate-binding protein
MAWLIAGSFALAMLIGVATVNAQSAASVAVLTPGVTYADIPIEIPDPLDLTINRSAAKAMGFKIRDKILEHADRLFK